MKISLRLNGTARSFEAPATTTLYQLLPGIGPDEGPCVDGRCMRCCVLLGERVMPSCLVPAYRANQASVTDMHGLSNDEIYQDIHRAFEKVGLARCIEAYPAMVMLARQLISETGMPSDAEIRAVGSELVTQCASRDEFERAVRLAARVYNRRTRE